MKVWLVIRKHEEGLQVLETKLSLSKAQEELKLYKENLFSFASKDIYLQEFESKD